MRHITNQQRQMERFGLKIITRIVKAHIARVVQNRFSGEKHVTCK
jgi:hypothetical protein